MPVASGPAAAGVACWFLLGCRPYEVTVGLTSGAAATKLPPLNSAAASCCSGRYLQVAAAVGPARMSAARETRSAHESEQATQGSTASASVGPPPVCAESLGSSSFVLCLGQRDDQLPPAGRPTVGSQHSRILETCHPVRAACLAGWPARSARLPFQLQAEAPGLGRVP